MQKMFAAPLIGATVLTCSPASATRVVERRDGSVVVHGNDDGVKVRQRNNGTLVVHQKGDDRNLGVRQVGGDNALKVRQKGDDTLLRVRQDGDENGGGHTVRLRTGGPKAPELRRIGTKSRLY